MSTYKVPSTRAILSWILGKALVQPATWVARMEADDLLDIPRTQPHFEELINSGKLIHVIAGPSSFDGLGQVSASLEICGFYAKGKWALWPVPFKSRAWQLNYIRLARYRNYAEIIPGYIPARVPFDWPTVGDHHGMLWEFSAEGDTLPEFYKNLTAAIKMCQKLSSDVLLCAADEYAYQVAAATSYDLTFVPQMPKELDLNSLIFPGLKKI